MLPRVQCIRRLPPSGSRLRAGFEELDAVRTLVEQASQAYALSEDMTYWMELTITESMINAIRHGNRCDP